MNATSSDSVSIEDRARATATALYEAINAMRAICIAVPSDDRTGIRDAMHVTIERTYDTIAILDNAVTALRSFDYDETDDH